MLGDDNLLKDFAVERLSLDVSENWKCNNAFIPPVELVDFRKCSFWISLNDNMLKFFMLFELINKINYIFKNVQSDCTSRTIKHGEKCNYQCTQFDDHTSWTELDLRVYFLLFNKNLTF